MAKSSSCVIERVRAYKYNDNKDEFTPNSTQDDQTKSMNIIPRLPLGLAQSALALKQRISQQSSSKM